MKRTVLIFGLISGAISSAMMVGMLPFIDRINLDHGEIIGYTTMVVSFLMVFFGIRSYCENVANGQITFVRAFSVGILITLVSCALYVITWEIIYFKIAPEFADKFTAHIIEKVKAWGATQQVIDAKIEEMKQFKAMYDKPLFNAAITFMEPFPVGLLITLISAAILRKKKRVDETDEISAGAQTGGAGQQVIG